MAGDMKPWDIAIVGAGAAGLAAAVFASAAAAEEGVRLRVVLVDGARRPGAKILVSGGGRCNVTNERVTPEDFEGGSRAIIRKVLRGFDEQRARDWFASLGVKLKAEPHGKLFPEDDKARTVLDALLGAVHGAGVEAWFGRRVTGIEMVAGEGDESARFRLKVARSGGSSATEADEAKRDGSEPEESLLARRVILAAGGMALPKSGSDGAAFGWLRAMGHRVIAPVPALAPLVLAESRAPGGRLRELAGITLDLRLELRDADGRLVASQSGSTLFTHFGLSGPAPMNLSRHLARARNDTPTIAPLLRVTLGHPSWADAAAAERMLVTEARRTPSRRVSALLGDWFPERLARLLGDDLGTLGGLTREARREAAVRLAALPVEVSGDRGFAFAETTAGGVDLREVDARTMESRVVPGLHLCGELLDADGRIGGFNFQWAWATGYLAGRGAARG